MKKFKIHLTFYGWYLLGFCCLMVLLLCCACTKNRRARVWGGTEEIHLPEGTKLMNITWKDNSLWYLVEPMEEGYTPKTKMFIESSSLGVLQGKVILIESNEGHK